MPATAAPAAAAADAPEPAEEVRRPLSPEVK